MQFVEPKPISRVLRRERRNWGPRPDIRLGSSAVVRLPDNTVDLAITSPPYVNGMDYVMNYKIDLAWMDFIESYEELAALRASMVACDNIPRGTAADHRPSHAVRSDRWLESVVHTITQNIDQKGSYRRDDMGSIVRKYFDDLLPVIENVFRSLRPGGRFVVVNGDSLNRRNLRARRHDLRAPRRRRGVHRRTFRHRQDP